MGTDPRHVGVVVFTVMRVAKSDGTFEDVQVESAEAVMAVLRDPRVRRLRTDESFFVLRAKDADFVRMWAHENRGTLDGSEYLDTLALADRMDEWQSRRSQT